MRRRQLLRTAGAATTVAIAGCTGGSGSGDSTTTTTTAAETSSETTTTATETTTVRESATTESATTAGQSGSETSKPYLQPAPKTVDQFLANANFYNGNMVVGVPLVAVGAGQEQIGFDPAAITISTGTEITWEWVSGNEAHNVVSIGQVGAAKRTLDSGEPQKGNGIAYTYTFENPGIYRYVCTTHRDQGARGAVVVREGRVGENGSG